jgi:hypothetical protein
LDVVPRSRRGLQAIEQPLANGSTSDVKINEATTNRVADAIKDVNNSYAARARASPLIAHEIPETSKQITTTLVSSSSTLENTNDCIVMTLLPQTDDAYRKVFPNAVLNINAADDIALASKLAGSKGTAAVHPTLPGKGLAELKNALELFRKRKHAVIVGEAVGMESSQAIRLASGEEILLTTIVKECETIGVDPIFVVCNSPTLGTGNITIPQATAVCESVLKTTTTNSEAVIRLIQDRLRKEPLFTSVNLERLMSNSGKTKPLVKCQRALQERENESKKTSTGSAGE